MKRLIIGIVILIVLLAGGFTAAIMTINSIDWSEYEEPVVKAVRDATGRELHFNGTLNVNIGLSPGIGINEVTLQNAGWASRDKMLTLDHVEVHLKLLPLVFGQIELSRLEISGLDMLLETDRQGRGNWEFEPAGTDEQAPVDSEPASPSGGGELLTGAFIKKAVIHDARIGYKDGVTGESQRFGIEELIATMDSASAPLVVDLRATFDTQPVEMSGRIDGMAGLLADRPLGLDLTVKAFGATAKIEGAVDRPLEASGIAIAIDVSGDSLEQLAELADTPLVDPGAYRLRANMTGTNGQFAITDLSIGISDMQIDGDLKANLAAEPLQIEATLHAPRIDLTRLLPDDDSGESSPAEEKLEQESGANERVFPDDPLPLDAFDALDTIDATVNLSIGELVVDPETRLADIDIGIHATRKSLSFTPLKLDAMGAKIDGRLTLKAMKKTVAVSAILNIRHPAIGDLVEVGSRTMLAGGPLDLDLDVTGSGASIRAIMASLNGTLTGDLGAAQINSQWIQQAFAEVRVIMKKPATDKPVDLYCMTAGFRIKNGLAESDHLVIDTRGMLMFGAGRINLRDESLHLDFDLLAPDVSTSMVLPPLKVRGTLAAPTGRVDVKALAGKALGLGSAPVTPEDLARLDVAARAGPERCRQQLVVYEQIRADRRSRAKENPVESTEEAVEATKQTFKTFRGFFRKKK